MKIGQYFDIQNLKINVCRIRKKREEKTLECSANNNITCIIIINKLK